MNAPPTLAETMEAERQRLTKTLEAVTEKRFALDQEERSIKIELAGIQAYMDAKMLKVMPGKPEANARPPKATGTRGPRKTGVKERIMEVMTLDPISKQDILAKLEAGDDKAMNQAISNSLVALKKDTKIVSRDRGTYSLPPVEVTPPATDITPPPAAKRVKKTEEPAPLQ